MRNPMPGRGWWPTVILLLAMMAFTGSSGVRAAPIKDFITIQPIDVCSGAAGTTIGCAPINNKGQNYKTAATGAIGFVDAATGINITDAIWGQAGLGITFLPAVQEPNSGSSLVVQVASCASNGTDCTSPQFQTLSDQASISMGGRPSPSPPLSANPTTMNMFFVTKLNPPSTQPGTLFGLAWINNNGIAIASNALLGLGARVDTLAHEIGHDLDLDHITFGAGAANNLLTAGSARNIPTSTSNALAQLAAGTADQLVAQQIAQITLSGFVSPIPNVVTDVTDPVSSGDFSVGFANAGRVNESLKMLSLAAPADSYLVAGTFAPLDLPQDTAGLVATPSFSDCAAIGGANACRTLGLTFTGTPFELGDNFDYTVDVCEITGPGEPCKTVPVADLVAALADGAYTYQFSDGFQTTSVLTGETALSANSWAPDPTVPSEIYNQTLLFDANTGQSPCTLVAGVCPGLNLEDGSPIVEGTLAVPEPPTILMTGAALCLLMAVRLWPAFWPARYSKPALRNPSRI